MCVCLCVLSCKCSNIKGIKELGKKYAQMKYVKAYKKEKKISVIQSISLKRGCKVKYYMRPSKMYEKISRTALLLSVVFLNRT